MGLETFALLFGDAIGRLKVLWPMACKDANHIKNGIYRNQLLEGRGHWYFLLFWTADGSFALANILGGSYWGNDELSQ